MLWLLNNESLNRPVTVRLVAPEVPITLTGGFLYSSEFMERKGERLLMVSLLSYFLLQFTLSSENGNFYENEYSEVLDGFQHKRRPRYCKHLGYAVSQPLIYHYGSAFFLWVILVAGAHSLFIPLVKELFKGFKAWLIIFMSLRLAIAETFELDVTCGQLDHQNGGIKLALYVHKASLFVFLACVCGFKDAYQAHRLLKAGFTLLLALFYAVRLFMRFASCRKAMDHSVRGLPLRPPHSFSSDHSMHGSSRSSYLSDSVRRVALSFEYEFTDSSINPTIPSGEIPIPLWGHPISCNSHICSSYFLLLANMIYTIMAFLRRKHFSILTTEYRMEILGYDEDLPDDLILDADENGNTETEDEITENVQPGLVRRGSILPSGTRGSILQTVTGTGGRGSIIGILQSGIGEKSSITDEPPILRRGSITSVRELQTLHLQSRGKPADSPGEADLPETKDTEEDEQPQSTGLSADPKPVEKEEKSLQDSTQEIRQEAQKTNKTKQGEKSSSSESDSIAEKEGVHSAGDERGSTTKVVPVEGPTTMSKTEGSRQMVSVNEANRNVSINEARDDGKILPPIRIGKINSLQSFSIQDSQKMTASNTLKGFGSNPLSRSSGGVRSSNGPNMNPNKSPTKSLAISNRSLTSSFSVVPSLKDASKAAKSTTAAVTRGLRDVAFHNKESELVNVGGIKMKNSVSRRTPSSRRREKPSRGEHSIIEDNVVGQDSGKLSDIDDNMDDDVDNTNSQPADKIDTTLGENKTNEDYLHTTTHDNTDEKNRDDMDENMLTISLETATPLYMRGNFLFRNRFQDKYNLRVVVIFIVLNVGLSFIFYPFGTCIRVIDLAKITIMGEPIDDEFRCKGCGSSISVGNIDTTIHSATNPAGTPTSISSSTPMADPSSIGRLQVMNRQGDIVPIYCKSIAACFGRENRIIASVVAVGSIIVGLHEIYLPMLYQLMLRPAALLVWTNIVRHQLALVLMRLSCKVQFELAAGQEHITLPDEMQEEAGIWERKWVVQKFSSMPNAWANAVQQQEYQNSAQESSPNLSNASSSSTSSSTPPSFYDYSSYIDIFDFVCYISLGIVIGTWISAGDAFIHIKSGPRAAITFVFLLYYAYQHHIYIVLSEEVARSGVAQELLVMWFYPMSILENVLSSRTVMMIYFIYETSRAFINWIQKKDSQKPLTLVSAGLKMRQI